MARVVNSGEMDLRLQSIHESLATIEAYVSSMWFFFLVVPALTPVFLVVDGGANAGTKDRYCSFHEYAAALRKNLSSQV
jgi:hypothetical protein